jgi:GT2 family glycosyltransferase
MDKTLETSLQVSCIIVNYRSIGPTQRLVQQLAHPEIETLVVDQTPDDTQQTLTGVTYMPQTTNTGFGSGANTGARQAKGEWLLILNPDVAITGATVLQWAQALQKDHIDAACPMTHDPRYDHPLPTVWWFLAEYTPLKRISVFASLARRSAPQTLWGGCLLIKRSVFEALGGFDERFFLWFEDSDITRRLYDARYRLAHTPGLEISHVGGSTFVHLNDKEKRRIFFTSAFVYARKHCSLITQALVKLLQIRYTS